jgi:hypothetical protein
MNFPDIFDATSVSGGRKSMTYVKVDEKKRANQAVRKNYLISGVRAENLVPDVLFVLTKRLTAFRQNKKNFLLTPSAFERLRCQKFFMF